MGFANVMGNLLDGSSGPRRHPATTQIWRTSGQKNAAGPGLENIIPGTFASGLQKLGRRHTVAPSEPEWKILEEQPSEEMAMGRSPSTIKAAL